MRQGYLFAVMGGALVGSLAHAGEEKTVVASKTDLTASLGLELYQSVSKEKGNICLSPSSAAEALALLSVGSEGKTKEELLHALNWIESADRLAELFAAEKPDKLKAGDTGMVLTRANGLWFQKGSHLTSNFEHSAQRSFDAEIQAVDFVHRATALPEEINAWVKQKTHGKVLDLVPKGSILPASRMVLVNAVYFKGRWAHPFKATRTAPRPFYLTTADKVMTPMMTTTADLRVDLADPYQLVELPYIGSEISMIVLLPKSTDGLAEAEKDLSADRLADRLSKLLARDPTDVHLTLPRFKVESSNNLKPGLEQRGVHAAFTAQEADFSPINGGHDLFVSFLLQKALVEVNEEGTEAAAGTAGGLVTLAVHEAIEFNTDHPFLFLIRENASGRLLFIGRCSDPGN